MISDEFKYWAVFAAILAVFIVVSSLSLTTAPRFWFDEGINLQIARNFAEQGYLNVQTAPGEPYGNPYQFLTTGYPVSGLLGLIFKLTGFSFAVGRGYMLGWMAALLLSVFLVSKKFFGPPAAVFSVLLVSSFPPIIFHGKSLIGEIPGLTLLLFGLWALNRNETRDRGSFFWPVLSGLFLGLSVATKPIFLLFVLALAVSYFWGEKVNRKKEAVFWLSLFLPVALYAYTALPDGFNLSKGLIVLETYQSRSSQGSFWANVSENAGRFFADDALIYSLLATIVIVSAIPWGKVRKREWDRPKIFLILSAAAMLLFFLQSVGWNRYLVVYQGLVLLALPAALFKLARGRRIRKEAIVLGLAALTLFQVYYLAYRSDFFSGALGSDMEKFFAEKAPEGRIYTVSALKSVAMIPSDRLYQFFLFEDRQVVPNLLPNLAEERFEYLFLDPKDPDAAPYGREINAMYERAGEIGEKILFKLK